MVEAMRAKIGVHGLWTDASGKTWFVIEDIGEEADLSVTNDAEAVVAYLTEGKKPLLPAGVPLLYIDSMGELDELVIEDGEFAGFRRGPEGEPGAGSTE